MYFFLVFLLILEAHYRMLNSVFGRIKKKEEGLHTLNLKLGILKALVDAT